MPDFSIEEEFNAPVIGLDEVGRGPLAGPVISCGCHFKNYKIINEFKDFISFIHKAYMSLGNSRNLELTSAEKQYREKRKKYAILDSNVRKGDLLASANMKYMRTSEPGLTRLEINKLRNKKFLKDIPSGVRLSKNHFKND